MSRQLSKPLSLLQFCDIQGVEDFIKPVIMRKYANQPKKSYDDWYDKISKEFKLSVRKDFAGGLGLGNI